jgi:hypothetical protein
LFGKLLALNSGLLSNLASRFFFFNFGSYENFFDVGDGTEIAMASSGTRDVQGQRGLSTSNTYSAIEKARTEILSSHRDNKVVVETTILPELELYHTLHVNATKINAKGKVKTYTHTVDFKEPCNTRTNIEIAFYALGAGGSNSTISLNDVADTPIGDIIVPTFGSLLPGADYNRDTTGSYKESGFHGNYFKPNGFSAPTYTNYPVQMIVDSPAVPATLTDGYEYGATQSYSMSIPTNTITITYDEKC